MLGLLGEKVGMTQVYDEEGNLIPVTVVKLSPNVVTAVKTTDKHGYTAVQLGFGEKREKCINKPQRAYFKKNGLPQSSSLKEFRIGDVDRFKIGAKIKADVLKAGELVDIEGVSKGHGFQGVMKRWHFAGGADSHGCSISHRVPGSIGQRAYPGRVFPGKKMPGQMGDGKVTLKNLKVIGVESEQNIILIRGALPGANNAKICIYPLDKGFDKRVADTIGTAEESKSA